MFSLYEPSNTTADGFLWRLKGSPCDQLIRRSRSPTENWLKWVYMVWCKPFMSASENKVTTLNKYMNTRPKNFICGWPSPKVKVIDEFGWNPHQPMFYLAKVGLQWLNHHCETIFNVAWPWMAFSRSRSFHHKLLRLFTSQHMSFDMYTSIFVW